MSAGALAGLRVVEMGQLLAGPFCGQLMGDMGADVIKIEPPGKGDPMREWGQGEVKVHWEVIARNKRSVTCNLRSAEGQRIARALIRHADVLIENFRPGTLERWNLDPAEMLAEQPGLIVARMSGYGQTGPYRDRPGFGGIGEAVGGWRHIVGEPDRPPARMGVSIGDTLTASYGALGILGALHHRDRTGDGQVVDTALYESVLQVMEGLVVEYDRNGLVRQRSGSILPGIAPSNVYPCRDGSIMIGANNDGIFARLAKAMGQPDLADDPRYATHLARGEAANQRRLDEIIEDWTKEHRVAEVEALMVEHSIPAGRVYTAADMVEDPHFAEREAIVTLDTAAHGPLKMQGVFPKLSRTPSSIRRPAPTRPGEHNAEIYGELLGWDGSKLREMEAGGVI
jgi:formyl-CoA transferase